MSDSLKANSVLAGGDLLVEHSPVPNEDVVGGSPQTGEQTLVEYPAFEIGIWEITPGVVTDVEGDETFVVLSGVATVELLESGEVLQLAAGSVARLESGTHTRWTVTETLRKVYVVPA